MIKQSFHQTKNGFYQNVNAALNRGYFRIDISEVTAVTGDVNALYVVLDTFWIQFLGMNKNM